MRFINNFVELYQDKIGSYDKYKWEQSLEQRILQSLGTRKLKDSHLKTDLLDFDAIRGPTNFKAKARHSIKTVVKNGILRILFAPFYFHFWSKNLSPRLAIVISAFSILQIIQISIYFTLNTKEYPFISDHLMIPLVAALATSILYSHITSFKVNSTESNQVKDTVLVGSFKNQIQDKKVVESKADSSTSNDDLYHYPQEKMHNPSEQSDRNNMKRLSIRSDGFLLKNELFHDTSRSSCEGITTSPDIVVSMKKKKLKKSQSVKFEQKITPPTVKKKNPNISETEYERINSDVGNTDIDTSSQDSGDEDSTRVKKNKRHRRKVAVNEDSFLDSIDASFVKDNAKTTPVQPSKTLEENVSENTENFPCIETTDDLDKYISTYFSKFQAYPLIASSGYTNRVNCYIWQNQETKKVEMTLLDIGWSIIRMIERYPLTTDYITFSVFFTIFQILTPVVFHLLFENPNGYENITLNNLHIHNMTQLYDGVLKIYNKFHNADSVFHSLVNLESLKVFIFIGILLRSFAFSSIFFLFCVAERSFQQRLLYAKYFSALTSSRRARKLGVPHFRLNKPHHIKCWLTLRSYLKKRGPQRSVEAIIAASFYTAFIIGLIICIELLPVSSSKNGDLTKSSLFIRLANWDMLVFMFALGIFLLRFLTLGTKISEKYQNFSILTTEQMNVYFLLERKPYKKDELSNTTNVLRLAGSLLKQVDSPFKICGWAVNPVFYNVFKLVLLSCFSALLSDLLGFKLKLYKLKLNPIN